MGILSGIVSAVTTVAETVAASIAAAIAAPTVSTVAAAVATVAVVVGGAYLIYKGVKKLVGMAENYVDSKRCSDNVPLRFGNKSDEYDDYVDRKYGDRSESVAKKVFKLARDERRSSDDEYRSVYDDIIEANTRRHCNNISGFYDRTSDRFVPRNVDITDRYYLAPINDSEDVLDRPTKRKTKKFKKSKKKNFIDAEYTDIVEDLNKRSGIRREHANNICNLYGLGPNPGTTCLS